MKKKNRGIFITFEGGEGAGKTTLTQKIYQDLLKKGDPVIQTFEPGATPLGKKIRTLILDQTERMPSKKCELFLFLADRSHHVEEVILPALREGKIVLCDRFNDSTFAYQGEGCGFDESFVRSLCAAATGGLTPDLTLYLDLDPKVGLERIKKKREADRFEEQNLSFHEAVRARFRLLSEKEPHRVRLLSAQESEEELYAQALDAIESLYV